LCLYLFSLKSILQKDIWRLPSVNTNLPISQRTRMSSPGTDIIQILTSSMIYYYWLGTEEEERLNHTVVLDLDDEVVERLYQYAFRRLFKTLEKSIIWTCVCIFKTVLSSGYIIILLSIEYILGSLIETCQG